MKTVTTKAMAKVAAVATGLAMATSMLSLAPMAHAASLTASQVQSILSLLSSFGAGADTIANVNSALTGAPSTTTTGSTNTTTSSSYTFTRDLTVGSTGADVTALQNALKAAGYMSANATGYFGALTKAGVAAWQTATGISPAAGYFGPKSRAAWNLGGGSSTTTTTTTTTTGTVTAGTGNGLKIMLSPTSPSGTVLVQAQGIGVLGEFVFANPTASPINVTNLSFKRIGVSNDSTLTNVYLYNAGTRLTDSAGVSNSSFSFADPVALFTVPAGQTYTVAVRSDILTGTSGQQIGVQLVSATSNGTLDSSVSFPINSGYQTVSAADLSTVNFSVAASPAADTSISPTPNYPVWQDTITVSTNPVKLSSMKFTNLGSIDSTYVSNLRLYVDGTQVGTAVASMGTGRSVTFDLSAAPFTMSTQSHIVKVLADVTGGSSRTMQFSVQRSSDAMFVDSQLNQPVTPKYLGAAFSAVTTGGVITVSSVAATSGVSVSLDPASPNSNVSVGASNVKWASFDMLASGENVKVSDLYVSASSTLSTGALAGVGGLNNGKIFVNGVQVGSTKDLGSLTAATTDFSLGSSLILPPGQVVTVDIYADAQDTAGTNLADGSTVIVALDTVAGNAQGQSSLNATRVPGAKTNGNTITVSSSSLTATKYSGYGNQTLIAGQNNAKIGAFTLSSGATEGVTVNTIVFSLAAADTSTLTNLTLKDDATGAQIGTVLTTPSTTNTYAVNIDIPASSTKTINIYANILSAANVGTLAATVKATSTTGTGDITGIAASVASDVTLQTITIGTAVLSEAVNSGSTPDDAIVVAGSSSVKVGSFQFTAQYSPFTVQSIKVKIPADAATSVTAVTLKYKDASGTTQSATQALALTTNIAQTYATATFTGLTMNVPANGSSDLDVYVGIPTVASGAKSGAAISAVLDYGEGFKAVDSAGNQTTTLTGNVDLYSNSNSSTSGKGVMYVRKSVPTLSAVALSATLQNANGFAIARLNVAADPAGDISVGKIVFKVGKSAAVLLGATTTLAVYNGSSAVGGFFATTTDSQTITGGAAVDLFGATATSSGAIIFVPTNEQQIAAGTSVTYELRANVSGIAASTVNYVNVSIANPNSSSVTTDTFANASGVTGGELAGAPAYGFVWSDRSAFTPDVHSKTTSDWTNDFLLKGLPLTLANSSVTN
ncbi:MAG: peptidoglycan-binding domain-containing protein [Minisyncoccia bacterium]